MSNLKLIIKNNVTFIEGSIPSSIYQQLKKTLGYRDPAAFFKMKRMPKYDGIISTLCWNRKSCKCALKKDGVHFPTGLLSHTRKLFDQYGIKYDLVDARPDVIHDAGFSTRNLKLRDYQQNVVDQAVKKTRGIIMACTGAGKTKLSAALIAKINVKHSLFIVPSCSLMYQTKKDFQDHITQNGKSTKIGIIGDGFCDIQDITIATMQSLSMACDVKYEVDQQEIKEDVSVLIEKRQDILSFIKRTQLMIADECITGDSILYTKDGPVKICDAKNIIGKELLSYNGIDIVWKKITHFYQNGSKQIIKISLNNGESIKCTKNHPIMTDSGWKNAGQIQSKDKILCIANADVNRKFILENGEVQVKDQNMFQDIRQNQKDLYSSGNQNSNRQQTELHSVPVDADRRLNRKVRQYSRLLRPKEQKLATNTFLGMTKDLSLLEQHQIAYRSRQYLDLSQEMEALYIRTKEVKVQGSTVSIVLNKNSGQITKWSSSKDQDQKHGSILTPDSEMEYTWQYRIEQNVQNVCDRYTIQLQAKEKRELRKNGQIQQEISGQHGGQVTTEAEVMIPFISTHRGSQSSRQNLSETGFRINMEKHQLENQEGIITYRHSNRQDRKYTQMQKNMYRSACDTNFVGIRKIEQHGKQEVFDITVQDTHCFFSNGMLVHNCHHACSASVQAISDYAINAKYKFGASATPFRDMGDDILIEACFGSVFGKITASDLIRRGFLIKPKIKFIDIHEGMPKQSVAYQSIYKQGIAENATRNQIIANLAKTLQQQDRNIIILVKNIQHGNMLQEMIPGSMFLHGNHTEQERQERFTLIKKRDKSARITIGSSILDEGIDCPALDTLILGGSGKSVTKAMQRIGRILRPYQNKESGYLKKDALVIDFTDRAKYLLQHSRKRRKMYQSEAEFQVSDL